MNAYEHMQQIERQWEDNYEEALKAFYAGEISSVTLHYFYRSCIHAKLSTYCLLNALMDDDLREALRLEVDVLDNLHFLQRYCEAHLAKFGQEFAYPSWQPNLSLSAKYLTN